MNSTKMSDLITFLKNVKKKKVIRSNKQVDRFLLRLKKIVKEQALRKVKNTIKFIKRMTIQNIRMQLKIY